MVYFRHYRSLLAKYIAAYGVTIACDPDDDDVVMGWCCGNDGRLFYVYVKQIYRGGDLGTDLVFNASDKREQWDRRLLVTCLNSLLTKPGEKLFYNMSFSKEFDFYHCFKMELPMPCSKKKKKGSKGGYGK
jgi:hypothetical protein